MKKVLSMFLAVVMVFSCVPAAAAQGTEVSAEVETKGIDEALAEQLSGGGGDFQVSAIEPESPDTVLVTYAAPADCTLVLTVTDDSGEAQLARTELPVEAGTQQATVSTGLDALPQYYCMTAALYRNGAAVSNEFVNYDHTREYEEFLAMTPDDPAFAGQTVLDLGVDAEGNSNFAVVREDVRVVNVSSLDEVSPDGPSLLEDTAEFVLPAGEEQIDPGDKVLILPADDLSGAIAMVAGEVDESASLLEDGAGEAVAVTPANVATDVEDFYSYIRISADFTAGTEDLDTSSADPIVEFEEAALFDGDDFGDSKTFTVAEQYFGGVHVKDTLTLSLNGHIDFEFSGFIIKRLKKFEVSTTLAATNELTIQASKSAHGTRTVHVGNIPITSFIGFSIDIPVDVVIEATLNAEFEFVATQHASTTITAGYQSGSCYCTATSSASSGRTLKTQARATASLGVKAGLRITILGCVRADVSGEVGILAEVIAQSVNDTATYKHDCTACMDVSLYVYARPSISLQAREWLVGDYQDLASRTGDRIQSKIMGFYVSYRGGSNWVTGVGTCPNKRYLVTITVRDGATSKPLEGVKVGNLGTTGSNGKVSGFQSAGSFIDYPLERGGYEKDTVGVYVGFSPASAEASLYTKNNNEAVSYTMTQWNSYTDSERTSLIEQNLKEGIQVSLNTIEELELFAIYTIAGKPTQDIEFYVNTTEKQFDLSKVDWVPVGTEIHPFQGMFNGTGVTFTGLHDPQDSRQTYRGFFGAVGNNARVHDFTLSNVSLAGAEGRPVGAVADIAKDGAELSDVVVSGGSVSGATAGGMVGQVENAAVRNSYVSKFAVTGTQCAGGIAGAYTAGEESEITNCYATAQVSGGNAGALCGKVSKAAAPDLQEGETAQEVRHGGLQYAYYLASAGQAIGEIDAGLTPLVFPVGEGQAKGTDATQPISGDPSVPYASATTLLEALNLWYADFGAHVKTSSTQEVQEAEDASGVQTVPDGDAQDRYNHWYADGQDAQGNFANDGYPIFATRPVVYPLTVHYSYADGREAYPTVVLYYEEGAAYKVDSYKIDGYYTNDVVYEGTMPGYALDFFVVYYAGTAFAGDAKALTGDRTAAAGETYRVADEADLRALAAYAAGGGNTAGVTFEQTADITAPANWQAIGTQAHPFRGSYEGAGFQVKGLDRALFGYTDGAAVQNLGLEANITAQEDGGILAVQMSNTSLFNCVVSGSITSSAKSAGGIAVRLIGGQVDLCSVQATVQGKTGAGGIAVACTGGSALRNCSFTGAVGTDTGFAGGLTGSVEGGTLENSYTTAAVTGGTGAGGITGQAKALKLRNVFFAGTTQGDAITASHEDATFDGVYYRSGLNTAVTGAQAFQTDGAAALAEKLNGWVQQRNSAGYYIWAVPQPSSALMDGETGENTASIPALSLPYENWLLDLKVENGTVSYTFDEYRYGQFTVMIALYDENGRMLTCKELPEGQSSFAAGDADCAYARAFLCDGNMNPVATAVSSSQSE